MNLAFADKLSAIGHKVTVARDWSNESAPTVIQFGDGVLSGAADPRRSRFIFGRYAATLFNLRLILLWGLHQNPAPLDCVQRDVGERDLGPCFKDLHLRFWLALCLRFQESAWRAITKATPEEADAVSREVAITPADGRM